MQEKVRDLARELLLLEDESRVLQLDTAPAITAYAKGLSLCEVIKLQQIWLGGREKLMEAADTLLHEGPESDNFTELVQDWLLALEHFTDISKQVNSTVALQALLYFPVPGDVRRRMACHSTWASLLSACDVRIRQWASARLPIVFCEGVRATPASLRNAPGPGGGAVDLASGGERDPRSRLKVQAAWPRYTQGCCLPTASIRGGAAGWWGQTRTAVRLPASAWPIGAALPRASDPDTSPGPVPHGVGEAC